MLRKSIAGACDPSALKSHTGGSVFDNTFLAKAYSVPNVHLPAKIANRPTDLPIQGGQDTRSAKLNVVPEYGLLTRLPGVQQPVVSCPLGSPVGSVGSLSQKSATLPYTARANGHFSSTLQSSYPISSVITPPDSTLHMPTASSHLWSSDRLEPYSQTGCSGYPSSQIYRPAGYGVNSPTSRQTGFSKTPPGSLNSSCDQIVRANSGESWQRTGMPVHGGDILPSCFTPGYHPNYAVSSMAPCQPNCCVSNNAYSSAVGYRQCPPQRYDTIAVIPSSSSASSCSTRPGQHLPLHPISVTTSNNTAGTPPVPQPPNIDWRRVASDSSIRQSLFSSQATVHPYTTDEAAASHSSYKQLTGDYTTKPAECGCATSSVKKQDSLRRPFPTESTEIDEFSFSSSVKAEFAPSDHGESRCEPTTVAGVIVNPPLPSVPTISVDSGVPPPAKRPFNGYPGPVQSRSGQLPEDSRTTTCTSSLNSNSVVQMVPADSLPPVPAATNAYKIPNNFPVNSCAALQARTAKPVDPNVLGQTHRQPTTTEGNLTELGPLSASDLGDLDRYLQIPSVLFDSEDANCWTGRRDSCTMTAEVLSALSSVCSDGTPVAVGENSTANSYTNNRSLERSESVKSSHPVDDSYNAAGGGGLSAGMLGTRAGSDGGNISSGAHTDRSSSNVQNVADKLGISITPNDYQLLTNPHLANYVTDENTEAQLLR
ncbi:unnamed protein product [Calicophoron daubneyi]|uniref:Uncharacterized protein n=1 Tax=Calicophoron daubneyi TaxID=300641 RepID=A0AAV2T129_CALDB